MNSEKKKDHFSFVYLIKNDEAFSETYLSLKGPFTRPFPMDKKARDKLYLWTKNFGRDGFMRLQIFHLQRALNVRQKKLAVGEISLYDWSPVQQDWYWRPAVPTVILLPRMNIF